MGRTGHFPDGPPFRVDELVAALAGNAENVGPGAVSGGGCPGAVVHEVMSANSGDEDCRCYSFAGTVARTGTVEILCVCALRTMAGILSAKQDSRPSSILRE